MLWFRLSGSFLLRFADRQFLPLLFQLPPRSTRAEARAVSDLFVSRDGLDDNGCGRARRRRVSLKVFGSGFRQNSDIPVTRRNSGEIPLRT
jgi:hypothetical protein